MHNELLKIIHDYQLSVKKGVSEMQEYYSTKELLKGWKSKRIPKSGKLPSGIEFDFHGVGCFLEIEGVETNFDFGPEDRYDGFDLWRLTYFMKSRKNASDNFYLKNSELLEIHFNDMEKNKIIYRPNWFPGTTLYYFIKEDDGHNEKS